MNEFEKLLVLLVRSDVRFITVGGFACAFNGFVRGTEDLDLVIDASRENLARLLNALQGYGEGHARELKIEDFADEEGAIRLVEAFPLDMFVRISGLTYDDLKPDIRYADIDDARVPYLHRTRLIEIKAHSLREIDRLDVIQLRKLDQS